MCIRDRLEPPLRIHYAVKSIAREWVARAAIVFALLATALAGFARAGALRLRLAHSLANRSGWAVVSVSAFAVLLSAYPVVFGGKSLVAPITWDSRLLYDGIPTLPGYPSTFVTDAKGSDVGAVLWEHIPFSMIEHRAMFRDGEWPLWNRYNSAGSPLLGQGQSMFGNPLHLLVQAANGAAWAWDCDYLLEKWLLAVGLGLLVLAVTRRTFPALVVSLAAPFFGFFVYRLNHPAFFSFCTAPWPLYCWIRVSGARSLRSAGGWAAALILANIALMDSGTVKEAYVPVSYTHLDVYKRQGRTNGPSQARPRRTASSAARRPAAARARPPRRAPRTRSRPRARFFLSRVAPQRPRGVR